jgi:hypothetical protein
MSQPHPSDVRMAVLRHDARLRARGLHSVALLPGDGACAAVIVANVVDARAAERLAASILPETTIRIESMRFDDDRPDEAGTREKAYSPPPRDYLSTVLDAVVAG